jgi:hypothetical protein
MRLGIHNTVTQDTKISGPGPTPYRISHLGTLGTIHTDLNMTDLSKTIDKTYTKLHLTMREHVNLLIQDTGQHLPPPRIARRLKRKHHTDNLEPTEE